MTPALRRLAAALLVLAPAASAQIEHGGAPPSAWADLPGAVPTVTMEPVDVAALAAEDAARQGKGPFRFGANLAVDLGLEHGSWTELAGAGRVWRLRVASPGAHSLSFVFSRWDLPPGAELYVYDDARASTYGQFNVLNNQPSGEMAIRPLAGDAVTIELYEPGFVERPSALRVGTVVHDYVDVLKLLGDDSGAEGACEVDVACAAGSGWELQARSVARLIIGGSLCTGSLLNNTKNDGEQLFMSANHCGSLANAIFQFKYQKSGCSTGGAPTSFTVQGSTQLATSASLDYRLVRINSPIPASYAPYYAGWDRSGATPSSTVAIHHPGGDPKKISHDDHAPQKSGSQWRVVQWDLGVTEGGSSGCPLYSSQKRFIGQLCCGAAFCGFPFDDYFGRLDAQWSQIAQYLDPLGTGATAIDGYDPGGTSGGPDVTGIVPATVHALIPGSAQTVNVFGTGFSAAASVAVDGQPLFGIPSPFTVVSPSLITLDMPQLSKLGSVSITVSDASGSDSASIQVVAPPLPQLQAGTGDQPVSVLSFAGIDVTMSSLPNDLFVLMWSPSGQPSVLPGVISLEIGNAFAQLHSIGVYAIPASKAWTSVHLPLGVPLPGTTFWLEGAAVRASGVAYPLATSNRQQCQVLF